MDGIGYDNGWSLIWWFLSPSTGRPMSSAAPHYLLLSETRAKTAGQPGGWSFLLERIDGSDRIEAADVEPGVRGERLQLLAVVRGLEALEQPSRVTLITPSRYIGRGIRKGIAAWRQNGWRWERFGQMVDVNHADLWKKVDRAMMFHTVDCRVWNFARLFGRAQTISAHAHAIHRESLYCQDRKVAYQEPVVKSRQYSPPSPWTQIADSLAQTVNPFRFPPVCGYTG